MVWYDKKIPLPNCPALGRALCFCIERTIRAQARAYYYSVINQAFLRPHLSAGSPPVRDSFYRIYRTGTPSVQTSSTLVWS